MRQQLLRQISGTVLAIMLTLTFTQILVSAQEELQDEQRLEDSGESFARARRIEGLWESQVAVRVCETGDPITTFREMSLFIRGGSLMTTDNNPPTTRGPGFGRWRYVGGQRYTDNFRFFQFNPDGTFAGVVKVKVNITLSRGGNAYIGTGRAEIFDANDNLIGNVCFTDTAKRVE